MPITVSLPPDVEDELRRVAEIEHRSVQQLICAAIDEYLSMRETAEIRTDPMALRRLAEARESEQAGDVAYGAEEPGQLLAQRERERLAHRTRRDQQG